MKKICMVILDGFGLSDNKLGNAVMMAPPTNFLELWKKYPHSLLEASEEAVGLEHGQFGNSEVGHMTIGAGHKILQSNELISNFLHGNYQDNATFLELLSLAKEGKCVHLLGLLSDGKVHANIAHLLRLLEIFSAEGISNVFIHVISDGRDTDIHSLYTYISMLEEKIKETGVGKIASICGRYYAMDRDKNWDRTERYYDLLVSGKGALANSIPQVIQKCYERNVTDEFLPPIKTHDFEPISDGDILLWTNYRTDRAKQIMSAFASNNFQDFPVSEDLHVLAYSFLPIDNKIKAKNLLNRMEIKNPMGVYLSQLSLTQARIAETEKYAHVTYFFDGESNASLEGCQKFLIPSPKVATYDLKPEMSAVEVTKKCVSCMDKDYDFILVNFANPDMVGHTGNLDATIKACVTVDLCLKLIYEKAQENFYTLVVLADHGNADQMLDEKGNPVTTHTTSLVPFIITDEKIELESHGDLTNVAPTVLQYMEITPPKEMRETKSLLKNQSKNM